MPGPDTKDILRVVLPVLTTAIGGVVAGFGGAAFGLAIGTAISFGTAFNDAGQGVVDLPGIGGDIPNNTGVYRENNRLVLSSDRGFARTTSNPQSVIPIIIGTYLVYGGLADFFLLGENDKRMFAVVAIAQANITQVKTFIDNKDISTLPGFVDVDAGEEIDNNKPWIKFIGNGGESGDIVLTNSGKKNFGVSAKTGETAVTPKVNILKTVSGKNEVRVFVSIDVPATVKDQLDTVDAVYAGLVGEVLRIRAAHGASSDASGFFTDITFTAGATDAAGTVTDINNLAGAWFTATVINEDEVRIVSDHATQKWMLIPPKEPTTGRANDLLKFEISNFGTTFDYRLSYQKQGENADVLISEDAQCCVGGEGRGFAVGTTPTRNTILFDNESRGAVTANGTTTTVIDANQKWLQDEIVIGDEINFVSGSNKGEDSVLTDIDIENNKLTFAPAIAGVTEENDAYEVITNNFYFGASLPIAGDYNFILDIPRATNGATFKIAIVEVMTDFVETDSADYSDLTGETLKAVINGTERTVTFTGSAVDASTTATEIQNQWGEYVSANENSDGNIEIEALPEPVGSNVIAEVKQIEISGGTAADQLNFSSIFETIKNYDFPGTGYALINISKNNSISGNPRFSFKAIGESSNPASYIKKLFVSPLDKFHPGMGLFDDINEKSFDDSADFDNIEGLESNTAFLDIPYGQTIKILLQAGSLLLVKNAGRYSLIPETDSQVAAEIFETDDPKIDGIRKGSIRWSVLEETGRFNVLRVEYPDEDENNVIREIIIDVTGEVDVESGDDPRIFEDNVLINISDSNKDFRRDKAITLSAVTSRSQALRLGIQAFRKSNSINLALVFDVSIIHYFLQNGDVIKIHSDDLGFTGKLFRIMEIKENPDDDNLGFSLTVHEHFPEIYA